MTPKIIDWVDDTNLNTVNWQRRTLKRLANQYNINPGECVIFENVAKEKARIVINLNGLVACLIPPIDPARQLSMHLEIHEYLRAFTTDSIFLTSITQSSQAIQEKLARRKRLKERARRRRRKATHKG